MATKNLVPRGSGEGGIGVSLKPWGDAYFDGGHFNKGLYVSGVAVSTGDVGGLGGKWEDASTPGSIYYNDGDVGIGTTNPEFNLSIVDSTDAVIQLKGTDLGRVYFGDTADNNIGRIQYYHVNNSMQFWTNDAEQMRINSDGKVGIGTTNPSAALDLRRPNTATNSPAIMIGKDPRSSHGNMIIQGQIIGVHHDESGLSTVPGGASRVVFGNGDWRVERSTSTAVGVARTWETRLKILDNGNVGIGTTSPDAKLEVAGGINFSGNIIPANNDAFDIGSADKKVRDLYLGSNSLHIGGGTISSNNDERIQFHSSGILIGEALLIPDPSDPDVLYFPKAPQVQDAEGNPVSLLSADKLGLGTSEVTQTDPGDIKFKLLTDENRFIVGTTGEGNLQSGWYRFNDFQVKGATDIGSHSINPVDTRIYADQESFILFKNDTAGRKVAHLVEGAEEVSANNALALGISIKTDSSENPEDIEFTHTDGESYSLINGDSDSVGVNGLPVRQGFQSVSLGANPSPLLIDGGSF